MLKYTREEIEKKATKMLDCYAFLKYVDRVEIWKDVDAVGMYELHRKITNPKSIENVFKIKL